MGRAGCIQEHSALSNDRLLPVLIGERKLAAIPRRRIAAKPKISRRSPEAAVLVGLQHAVGNRAVSAAVQRLLAGRVPQAGWLAAHVPASAAYQALPAGDDVADFAAATKTAILTANANYYAGAGAVVAAPPPAIALPAPVSDESRTQLQHHIDASKITPEVDHIVPFSRWGCNDPRNARVLSYYENRAPATSRPPASDVIALENDHYLRGGTGIARGAVLTLADVNEVLVYRADVAAVANLGAVDDVVLDTIYREMPPAPPAAARGKKRRT